MAIYIKVNNTEYPAAVNGVYNDRSLGDRDTKTITLTMTHDEAAQLFVDGLSWSIVQRDTVPVYDTDGNPTGETEEQVQEWDNADYCVAGPITDNRDGTITVKMGKPMPLERAEAEKAAAQHTAATLMGMPVYTAIGEERAKDLRYAIETAAASLDDKTASEAPELFPQLTGDGSLVKSGTRICWQGGIKRAAVDLWDTAENTPDAAKNLWEDIQYKQGYRLIPETITATLAFAKGERGWWKDELYESLLAANVWNPSVNPDGWKKITEEGT